ncbi:hypothetical protein SODALDRAFT_7373 [Sodiomyces alkalinus F11]|uniref:Uncharacterized protein n=1 Tax=Sodiomyces alkalinus (strain CBS 110278 / VKM F-3762 / F11) TaxID=1314773 RepID=A0A3N2Q5W8_SODAK|nr:hypothetical protein SODALDRAFT_7373 [Sodiomyces alkalinus F11]ROT42096.1 hypothetical protein SODALDRAFT_7373 [Sodiomyces alkalinus F11]
MYPYLLRTTHVRSTKYLVQVQVQVQVQALNDREISHEMYRFPLPLVVPSRQEGRTCCWLLFWSNRPVHRHLASEDWPRYLKGINYLTLYTCPGRIGQSSPNCRMGYPTPYSVLRVRYSYEGREARLLFPLACPSSSSSSPSSSFSSSFFFFLQDLPRPFGLFILVYSRDLHLMAFTKPGICLYGPPE